MSYIRILQSQIPHRQIRKLFFFVAISLLPNCSSSTKGNWSCPTLDGGKGNCVSIKNADVFSVSGKEDSKFNAASYSSSAQQIEIKLVAPKLSELKKITDSLHLKSEKSSSIDVIKDSLSTQERLRSEEKVGRVWFAPYIDAEGNQHSEKVVHIVDEEPKWLIQR